MKNEWDGWRMSWLGIGWFVSLAGAAPGADMGGPSLVGPGGATVRHPPTVAIERAAAGATVQFRGALQVAPVLGGRWDDVTNAASPYAAGGVRAYYRARQPDSIFAAGAVVALVLAGPLQRHFDLAHAGQPDGIFPPVREKPYFDGTLSVQGYTQAVTVRVRGNSSLQECPFPKLKFKVSPAERAGTLFADAREVDVGTHCAEGGRGTIGRLREEAATYREALAYETMGVLGFVGPRVRRGRVEYRDTTPTNESPNEVGWSVTRDALLLENAEVLGQRLGGRALEDEEIEALQDAGFDRQLITDLRLFHVLLGNWDYSLSPDGQGLWNTGVIELPDGGLVPVPGDFDLSSWVTEVVRVNAPRDFRPELPSLDRETRYQLENLQRDAGGENFSAAAGRFAARRGELEAGIAAARLDAVGRSNALRHVTVLFEALEEMRR